MNDQLVDLTDCVMDFKPCIKKPIVIKSLQIKVPFQVQAKGCVVFGKSGDYLMCGLNGERYICNQELFKSSYDWIPED